MDQYQRQHRSSCFQSPSRRRKASRLLLRGATHAALMPSRKSMKNAVRAQVLLGAGLRDEAGSRSPRGKSGTAKSLAITPALDEVLCAKWDPFFLRGCARHRRTWANACATALVAVHLYRPSGGAPRLDDPPDQQIHLERREGLTGRFTTDREFRSRHRIRSRLCDYTAQHTSTSAVRHA